MLQNSWFSQMTYLKIFILLLFTLSIVTADPVRIMPLGDSITKGTEGSTHGSGYRGPLWTDLSTNGGYDINFVGDESDGSLYRAYDTTFFDFNHEGYNGWQADRIATNVDDFLGSNPEVDIILLHIGTNDLNVPSPDIGQTVADVEDILNNIDNFSTDVKVVLAKIIHQNPDDPVTTGFNAQLETMAKDRIANGDDIEIVDMETNANIDYSIDMDDRLHPNDSGYAKMANVWAKQLKTIIPMHKWELDDVAAPYIDNFRDANGNCIDGCPIAVTGKINSAQEFTDTNRGGIEVTDVSTFNWTDEESFTIGLWMKSDVKGAKGPDDTERNAVLIGREDTSRNLLWFIGTSKNTGKVIFYVNEDEVLSNSSVIGDNKWHYIVCVRDVDSNEIKMYVDGELQGTPLTVTSSSVDGGASSVNIGYLALSPGYEYNGLLDEITVYGGVLSEAKIRQDYQKAEQLIITTEPVTFARLGESYVYDVNSSDEVNTNYSLETSPSGMEIDSDTGLITWTPDISGSGPISVTVLASNGSFDARQNYVIMVDEIIVDNLDSGFSKVGTWRESSAPDEYAGSSLYSPTQGNSATWVPDLTTAGSYHVYVWYTGASLASYPRDTSADYTVNHAGGSQTIEIDQDQGSGAWVSLGVFSFNAGTGGNVTLVRNSATSSEDTSADAVKFVLEI